MSGKSDSNRVVFDLSLMAPPMNMVFKEMLKDNNSNTYFLMTRRMHDFLYKDMTALPWLLQFWGIDSTQAQLVTSWMKDIDMTNKKNTFARFEIIEMKPQIEKFGSEYLIGPLRNQMSEEKLVEFVHDEICIALEQRVPIFCYETSSYKIVEVLRNLGAKVKDEIIEYGESKKAMFSKQEEWRKIAAIAVKSAFVWLIGGPEAGLNSLGEKGITVIIEDP